VSATTHQHYLPVREDWLATTPEEAIDPAQPIIDPHHHLWDRPGWRYLLDEILADLRSGHDIRATVHVQARSMYRADAPAAPAAACSASGAARARRPSPSGSPRCATSRPART
jgi:hypothetical protein